MNKYVQQLASLAQKDKRRIIGLMSGTSLDGLDIALCAISGSGANTVIELEQFTTIAFDDYFKEQVRLIFSKRMVDFEQVCLLNPWIAEQHATMIVEALKTWGIEPAEIDLIASHGQTVYHAPKILHGKPTFGNATLQIGDGDHIAVKTGIITISYFRQKHIAAGGEGAPLAVYGDYFVFSKRGENRIMLNIGGVANFTYLPGDMDVAKQGNVNPSLLAALKEDDFFAKGFPKTTGPELFNLAYVERALIHAGIASISHVDTMATINQLSADTIVEAINRTLDSNQSYAIYSSGGGMHNPVLMQQIKAQLPQCSFYTTDQLAINPDAKEAVLFAVLANETVAGGNTPIGGGSKDIPAVTMGKISFPG